MLIGVCDFPGDYDFPPRGYGGIERWLWAVAAGARRAGARVHLLGPRWRAELAPEWTIDPVRLEDLTPGGVRTRTLRRRGYDLLVAGHEYPSLPAWRAVAQTLGADVVSFQHSPDFRHRPGAFDGIGCRLYCYSQEMTARYADCRPTAELAVHLGIGEDPPKRISGGSGLVWLGRIDADKAPHLAVRAARLLGLPITIAGPVFDTAYAAAHRELLGASHVTLTGEAGGMAKIRLLASARTFVYTCARDYVEAGAGTFGEALRVGTPVAALVWRPGSCAHAALCPRTGFVAMAEEAGDDQAVLALAAAIERASELPARQVQDVGLTRFDPARHFRALAARPC
jgi:glycosyltransferase involved in cell wall biosynthesis